MEKLKRQGLRAIFVAVAAALGGCAQEEPSAVVELKVAPCDPGFDGVTADCGELLVYENRNTKTGRVIPINFIRVRAANGEPSADVAIQLAGGPGAAGAANPAQAIAAARTLASRDLLLVDQRGTGKSNPLDCAKFDLQSRPEAFAEMFATNLFDTDMMQACKDNLSAVADLAQYTTSLSADDIDDLRAALGYETMTLFGASYGTTLALETIRRHGEHVRAAVLRGAIPPSINQTETIASDMEDFLQLLFGACENDAPCAGAYPDFRNDFYAVMSAVRDAPVDIMLPHTLTQQPEKVTLRYSELVAAVRYSLYSTQASAALPAAVNAAKSGDYTKLAQFLPQLIFFLGNTANEGMWASVRCAEEFPYLDVARARERSEGTTLGTERLDSGLAICAFWPRGEAAPDFHDPVVSDVPVLILSGEVDAATPPWMGAEAVRHLANGRQVIVPNRSHWGLSGDLCIEDFVDEFVKSASAANLDVSCLADYKRPPFVIPENE